VRATHTLRRPPRAGSPRVPLVTSTRRARRGSSGRINPAGQLQQRKSFPPSFDPRISFVISFVFIMARNGSAPMARRRREVPGGYPAHRPRVAGWHGRAPQAAAGPLTPRRPIGSISFHDGNCMVSVTWRKTRGAGPSGHPGAERWHKALAKGPLSGPNLDGFACTSEFASDARAQTDPTADSRRSRVNRKVPQKSNRETDFAAFESSPVPGGPTAKPHAAGGYGSTVGKMPGRNRQNSRGRGNCPSWGGGPSRRARRMLAY